MLLLFFITDQLKIRICPLMSVTNNKKIVVICYYRQIKKNLLGRACGKSWTFTRVPQYEFVGVANEEVLILSFHENLHSI
jgi:hypothetical protein